MDCQRERESDSDGSGQKQLLLLTKPHSDNSGPAYATECFVRVPDLFKTLLK